MDKPAELMVTHSLGQRLFYWVCRTTMLWTLRVFFRFRRRGMQRIPRHGAVLLVANHQSYLDPPIIGVCLSRQMNPIARAGLFVNTAFSWFLGRLNTISIREDGAGDTAAMKKALRLLKAGEIVLLFPEGTRTETGEVGEFKRGAGLLIKRAKCPVAPVAIDGAFEAWPRTRKTPKLFSRVRVQIGEPIEHDELMTGGVDAALERLRGDVVDMLKKMRETT